MQIAKEMDHNDDDEQPAAEKERHNSPEIVLGTAPIYEILPSCYTDGQREITVLRPVDGGPDLYLGKGIRTEPLGGRVAQRTFTFRIPAASLREAFERFDACMVPAGEAVGAELRKAMIAGAAQQGGRGPIC